MLLYKAVKRGKNTETVRDVTYMAVSVESAFMWGYILFGATPYFINEYKVPNTEMCIWGIGTYRFTGDHWTGGENILDPIPLSELPELPDNSQVVVWGNSQDYEYRQIAYFDGEKLISKKQNDAARIEISHKAGNTAGLIEKLDYLIDLTKQYTEDYSIVRADGLKSIIKALQTNFDEIITAIDSMAETDGLTMEYQLYLQKILDVLKALDESELQDLVEASNNLDQQDKALKQIESIIQTIDLATKDLIDQLVTVDFLEPTQKNISVISIFKSWFYRE